MIQNSIDRSCNEQAFVKFLLALTKIPVPTVAFPLALRAKNEWEKNVKLDKFSKFLHAVSGGEWHNIHGCRKALFQNNVLYSKCSWITFHSLETPEFKDDYLI